ncbi:MAG: DoxX family protein [Bacteroidota bacterium]
MIEPHSAAALLTRLFLGILFLFQGYDKVFTIKIAGVIEEFRYELNKKHIPLAAVRTGAWITSLIELAGGALLILGIAKYTVLYFLAADIIMVSIAFSIIRPMWDLQFVFPRLLLLILLLILPAEWDVLSVDYFLK